jgi:hypothetical protein
MVVVPMGTAPSVIGNSEGAEVLTEAPKVEVTVGTASAVGQLDVKAISKFFLLGDLVTSELNPMAEN